jgi:PTH1 family peptidyl-tRNA hydrolase
LKVILGLGNPGREYEATRHNVGWWVLDHLADVWRLDGWRAGNDALAADGVVAGHKVRLVKPQTYYNLSGQALRPFLKAARSGRPQTDLLVVCDDVALPVGTFRVRPQGSAGGSNGLKSIERTLGHQHYPRLRVGTRPADEAREVGDLSRSSSRRSTPWSRVRSRPVPARRRRLRGVAARRRRRGHEQAQRAGAGEALTRPPPSGRPRRPL